MTHHNGRVERIKCRVDDGLKEVTALENSVTADYAQAHLGLARNRFNDVESQFVKHLDEMGLTADDEAAWLDQAEMILAVAEQDLSVMKGLVAKYGPNLESNP
jgi:hypothetical protein